MSKKNRARIIIPCKFGYLNCWRPGVQYGGGPKYSVSAIIPKNDTETIDKIHQAIEFAKENSIQKWGGRSPIHDGDEEKPDNPIYQNCYYINAKSKDAPQVVDENVEPIIDQTQVYSGCSGNISIIFYGYNFSGNKGIAAGLGNIQKLEDGEPFGGPISAKEDFQVEDFLQ